MEGERLHLPEHVHGKPQRRQRVLLALGLTLGVIALGVAQFMVTLSEGRFAGVAEEFSTLRPELLPLSTRQAPDPETVQQFQQELQEIYQQLQPPPAPEPSTPVSQPDPASVTLPTTP
jgi:hypothetical protein